jgi:O-antigen ligase
MKNTSINKQEIIFTETTPIGSWPRATFTSLRTNITTPNLIGTIGGILALFLLLALHEPWNITIPLYLTILLWTILRPRVALYLMAFAVPWGSLDYIDIRGLRLNSADLLVAFLAIGWLFSFALRRTQGSYGRDAYGRDSSRPGVGALAPVGPLDREPSAVPAYLAFAILALLIAMVLSMTVATNIASSLKEISKWLEFLVLVLLGAQYIRTRRQLWTIILLICLAGITQAIFGYFQAFFNLGPVAFIRDTSLRIYGTFDQPNPYAGYINIPLSIALALMLLGSNWKTRILAGLTAILLAAAEYLTQSRGGELAIAAAALFIVAMGTPRLSITIRMLALAGLAAVEGFLIGLIPLYLLNPVLRSLGLTDLVLAAPTKQNFSTAERLAHWIAGLRMFLAHPILGVGIGNYPDAYPQYFVTIFTDPLGHAHNYYINIAAETGSIGLIAYLLFLLATFLAGAHSYRAITKTLVKARFIAHTVTNAKPVGADLSRPSPIYRPTGSQSISPDGTDAVGADLSCPSPQRSLRSAFQSRPAGELGPISLRSKLLSLIRSLNISQYDQHQTPRKIANMLINDRALAIGLLAALISVCIHNIFDDLYVHSITNLIALLLIALIRLEKIMPKVTAQQGVQGDAVPLPGQWEVPTTLPPFTEGGTREKKPE